MDSAVRRGEGARCGRCTVCGPGPRQLRSVAWACDTTRLAFAPLLSALLAIPRLAAAHLCHSATHGAPDQQCTYRREMRVQCVGVRHVRGLLATLEGYIPSVPRDVGKVCTVWAVGGQCTLCGACPPRSRATSPSSATEATSRACTRRAPPPCRRRSRRPCPLRHDGLRHPRLSGRLSGSPS